MEKILVFDYDGTIVNSGNIVKVTVNRILKSEGIGQIKRREDFQRLYDNNFYEGIIALGVPRKDLAKILLREKKELEKYQHKTKMVKGMKTILAKLSAKNKVFIATSNLSSIVKEYFEMHSVKGITQVLGADTSISKVDKIRMIKKKYPGRPVYYIGDTVGDVFEGKKAKVKTVAVSWGYHSYDRLKKAGPDHVLQKPEQLLKLFSQ